MERIETPHGTVEVVESMNLSDIMIRFVDTGGTVITTRRKLNNGTVKDPMKRQVTKRKLTRPRWEVVMTDGTTFTVPELSSASERIGLHEATVRKVAQGERRHALIESITRI